MQRGADQTKAAENIIVPKGSPIQTLADLKGKKLAIPQGSSAHGLALLALKSVGLTPKDIYWLWITREGRKMVQWQYLLGGAEGEPTTVAWTTCSAGWAAAAWA